LGVGAPARGKVGKAKKKGGLGHGCVPKKKERHPSGLRTRQRRRPGPGPPAPRRPRRRPPSPAPAPRPLARRQQGPLPRRRTPPFLPGLLGWARSVMCVWVGVCLCACERKEREGGGGGGGRVGGCAAAESASVAPRGVFRSSRDSCDACAPGAPALRHRAHPAPATPGHVHVRPAWMEGSREGAGRLSHGARAHSPTPPFPRHAEKLLGFSRAAPGLPPGPTPLSRPRTGHGPVTTATQRGWQGFGRLSHEEAGRGLPRRCPRAKRKKMFAPRCVFTPPSQNSRQASLPPWWRRGRRGARPGSCRAYALGLGGGWFGWGWRRCVGKWLASEGECEAREGRPRPARLFFFFAFLR
jgi:hypothetical protein